MASNVSVHTAKIIPNSYTDICLCNNAFLHEFDQLLKVTRVDSTLDIRGFIDFHPKHMVLVLKITI